MRKKLTKVGNSRAILLDKAVLDLLKIAETDEFDVSTDGQKIILTPARDNDAEFERAIRSSVERSRDLVKKLAEKGDGAPEGIRSKANRKTKAAV